MRTLLCLLAVTAGTLLCGCDSRSLAKPNPRINKWEHVVNVLDANEGMADVTNDGGSGWIRLNATQDGRDVGSARAYFAAGQQQVVRFPISSTMWKLQLVTNIQCVARAE
jgi:hypothetical protein